ncbi:hypothetical protein NUW54_g9866 [Trametes sanguinea]|uniref:Uncharacterized protein n=1 Tax=Trametes sanguinea TaxID=158606 RepID=A0ACC1P312_9APHY|nr:hypothetical protein NUW54_g9866 [Trametes sanguinea]
MKRAPRGRRPGGEQGRAGRGREKSAKLQLQTEYARPELNLTSCPCHTHPRVRVTRVSTLRASDCSHHHQRTHAQPSQPAIHSSCELSPLPPPVRFPPPASLDAPSPLLFSELCSQVAVTLSALHHVYSCLLAAVSHHPCSLFPFLSPLAFCVPPPLQALLLSPPPSLLTRLQPPSLPFRCFSSSLPLRPHTLAISSNSVPLFAHACLHHVPPLGAFSPFTVISSPFPILREPLAIPPTRAQCYRKARGVTLSLFRSLPPTHQRPAALRTSSVALACANTVSNICTSSQLPVKIAAATIYSTEFTQFAKHPVQQQSRLVPYLLPDLPTLQLAEYVDAFAFYELGLSGCNARHRGVLIILLTVVWRPKLAVAERVGLTFMYFLNLHDRIGASALVSPLLLQNFDFSLHDVADGKTEKCAVKACAAGP